MSCPQGRKVLPFAMLLLLLSFQLLITPVSEATKEIFSEETVKPVNYLPTVEFAVNTFNQNSQDEYAYRLEHILSSWQEEVEFPIVLSVKIQLRRTRCNKFEDSLDTCPFQETRYMNSTITCLFTVGTFPWKTEFQLRKQECS